jgi:hypothetical protein
VRRPARRKLDLGAMSGNDNLADESQRRLPVMSKPLPARTNHASKARSRKKPRNEAEIAATLNNIEQLKPKSKKAAQMLGLLKSWLNDKSGYDEKNWPKLKKALERERKRVGARRLFDG